MAAIVACVAILTIIHCSATPIIWAAWIVLTFVLQLVGVLALIKLALGVDKWIEKRYRMPARIRRGHEPSSPNYVIAVHEVELSTLRGQGISIDSLAERVLADHGLKIGSDLLAEQLDDYLVRRLAPELRARRADGVALATLCADLRERYGDSLGASHLVGAGRLPWFAPDGSLQGS